MVKDIAFVFLGGGIGSVLRYLIGRLTAPHAGNSLFPWGTFIANTLGCLLIGALAAMLLKGCLSEDSRLLLIVGLCGGMTTFSTFSNEALNLLRNGDYAVFAVYMLATVTVGIISVMIGNKTVCN